MGFKSGFKGLMFTHVPVHDGPDSTLSKFVSPHSESSYTFLNLCLLYICRNYISSVTLLIIHHTLWLYG